jgi:agmatinase
MRRIHDLNIPIFQIGIRSLSASEARFREINRIPHLDADEIARSGFPETLLPTGFPKNLYITFDVDGLDPSLVPCTGTPEPGGLNWYQAIEGLENAMKGRKVIGADVVELAPLPSQHASDFITAKLVYKMMDLILKNR